MRRTLICVSWSHSGYIKNVWPISVCNHVAMTISHSCKSASTVACFCYLVAMVRGQPVHFANRKRKLQQHSLVKPTGVTTVTAIALSNSQTPQRHQRHLYSGKVLTYPHTNMKFEKWLPFLAVPDSDESIFDLIILRTQDVKTGSHPPRGQQFETCQTWWLHSVQQHQGTERSAPSV